MIIEVIFAIVLGVLAGIFTGLIPGIHINLISAVIVSLSATLLAITSPLSLIIFILSMSVTHTFIDSIPSIYLGAPDADMILTALPGHKMLMEGKGHIAIMLTLIGGLGGLILSIIFFPLLLVVLNPFASLIGNSTGYILLSLLFFLLLREKKRFLSLFIFCLSGLLGFTLFSLPLQNPLLALLTGLFGISLLLISLSESSSMPKQKRLKKYDVEAGVTCKSLFLSTLVGFFAAFLPGFGASQAAIYASLFLQKVKAEYFLILSGAINTIAMILSLATFVVLDKARNGSIIAISNYVTIVTQSQLILFCLIILIVGSCAMIIGARLSLLFNLLLQKINYRLLTSFIIVFLIGIVFAFDRFLGLLVLLCATSLGIVSQKLGVSKHYLLGCLLLPTILYLL